MFDHVPSTDHFEMRCRERRIPLDAHRVVVRHGRRTAGKQGGYHYRITLLDAHRLEERGVDVYRYAEITVVVAEGVAVTAYWAREEDAIARYNAPRSRSRGGR